MLSTADALSMLHVLRRAGALEPGVALAGIAASQQALLRSLSAMDADKGAVPA